MNGLADPDFIRTVALAAIEAARAAGATYADVRLTRDVVQAMQVVRDTATDLLIGRRAAESEQHGIGVRALVNGAWGFTASPYWTPAEAARLATDAVAQARENARMVIHRVELAPTTVAQGHWVTPYQLDPFAIPLEEKLAFIEDVHYTSPYFKVDHVRYAFVLPPVQCRRMETTLATTDGTFVAQAFYTTGASIYGAANQKNWIVRDGTMLINVHGGASSPVLGNYVQGTGWETLQDFPARAKRAADDAYTSMMGGGAKEDNRPARPVAPGRFTIVADSTSVGTLLGATLQAMDLDRVNGDEVNASGSSWLGTDPLALIGQFDFGTPLLSVTANRGLPNGPTWTKWDDEGVEATSVSLIKQGIIHDLPTARDTASMLAPAYQKLGRPLRSNGCAMATSAFEQQVLGVPDAVMSPGKENIGLDELVSSVSYGYLLTGMRPQDLEMDMELRRIVGTSKSRDRYFFREIVNGRIGAPIKGPALVINTPELWKNLTAIGGPSSLSRWAPSEDPVLATSYKKGQPVQSLSMSVKAVPGIFQNIAVADSTRGA